jgi:multidrug resistance efflux pump
VRKGQLLFQLDRARYQVALLQAEAALSQAEAALRTAETAPRQAQAVVARDSALLAQSRREAARNAALHELVSTELNEQGRTKVQEADASLQQAKAALQQSKDAVLQARAAVQQAHAQLDAARLNLQRTTVRAPVDGVVTNVDLRPGDYFVTGHQALALVDADSLHVDGYFEETKLPRIRVGDRVSVRLMGEPLVMYGHVQSIAAAIEDRERTPSANLVANVNPTFSWVRLAQRIPVRVVLDHPPANVRLIAGRTATVVVLTPHPIVERRDWWSLR